MCHLGVYPCRQTDGALAARDFRWPFAGANGVLKPHSASMKALVSDAMITAQDSSGATWSSRMAVMGSMAR